MTDRQRIVPRLIEDEIRESFINYSMSVIVSRALPDVRDGLKPVHRRVLYAMSELGLVPGRPFKKSATVVGDVLGKYHPHGDSSVYDALVRMVQDFSLRYPLVDGQGNFGSVDGDPAAAYRYTEARLTPLAIELLRDIDKETVDFVPNFDDRLQEPTVLPSGVPNLLVNGSSGIAVGMATNIPPHNLREVVAACVALIDDPTLPVAELRKHIKGPDFPTAGFIYGRDGITDYQETGRGKIVMRARAVIEERESNGRSQIVVTELPYQVNRATLVATIAELVRDKKVEGVSDLRDESDAQTRIVIELKKDALPRLVLNQLYKHTAMQSTFGVIMLALVPDPQSRRLVPRVLTLKEALEHYLAHRHEVIVRRAQHELGKARDREHILEGLTIAVNAIDAVIAAIRAAEDTDAASRALQAQFRLTERQADAILNMRLAKLTGLEIAKLEAELAEVRAAIAALTALLASREQRMALMKSELLQLADRFGDDRRTEITGDDAEFTVEDLIANEEMVVTISRAGYIKRTAISTYRRQRRGGRGITGAETKSDDDFIEHLFIARTHDYLLVFTEDGRVFWLKVHEVPPAGRAARGKPVVNLIDVPADTHVAGILNIKEFRDDEFLLFCTRNGTVKKTALSEYANPRSTGIKAIRIEEGDELMDVQVTSGTNDIVLATRHGKAIRFPETEVRAMGRDTTGVKGIDLAADDAVVGMVVVKREAELLCVSANGMGKRSSLDEYRVQQRGGKGIITLDRTDRTGDLVTLMEVLDTDEVMLITRGGQAIRTPVAGIRHTKRNAQGVKLLSLPLGDVVSAVARVVPEEGNEVDAGAENGPDEAADGGEGPQLELSPE